MGLLSWLKGNPSVAVKAAEGQYRPGPYHLPISGGWLSHDAGQFMNWWQMGYDPQSGGSAAMVEACVGAYSQTTAMCPGDHWRSTDDGGRERIKNSSLSRVLRVPNHYQTISDFMLNLTRSLYVNGNAYALALRNARFEVDQLHLMNSATCSARVKPETGEVFYQLGGNVVVDNMFSAAGVRTDLLVPARDVLHVRLHTNPANTLLGESPLVAALPDIAATTAMTAQQIAFYQNQARPSYVLKTDQILTAEQVDLLRTKWNEQSSGMNSGGTPILSAGLTPQAMSSSSKDAELASVMKLSDEHIALVFRVPLQILGIGTTPLASTEALMNLWISSGLGFAINHIEEAFDKLFALRGVPDEYVEFDTSVLLRSATKDRIDALVASTKGGIRTINEARREESLPKVKGGDDIRVQQQDVPLDWHEQQAKAEAAKVAQPPPKPDDEEPPEVPKDFTDADSIRRRFREAHRLSA